MKRYLCLDLVRGISAILVLANHLRATLLMDYGQLGTSSVLQKFFYFITGLGHQSVMIFFVLSGFLVGGSVLKQSSNFNWRSYLISRLSRLWVVLIPALILTIIVDNFINLHAPEVFNGYYSEIWSSGPLYGEYSKSLLTLLGNIFFLQNIFVSIFGSNGPLWSLAYEFWYYLLFPLALCALGWLKNSSIPNTKARTLSLIGSVLIFIMLPIDASVGFISWLLGVGVYLALKKNIIFLKSILISGVIFLGSIAFSKSGIALKVQSHISDLTISACFSLFLLAMVNKNEAISFKGFFLKFVLLISDISYSLYLIHFPIVVLIGGIIYKKNQVEPDFMGIAQYTGWLLALIFISFLFWLLFENKTETFKKFLTKRLPA